MEWVMCLACGEFARALDDDDGLVPLAEACSSCGGGRFKDTRTGAELRTDI